MLFLGVLCPDANKGRKGIASVRLGHKTLSPPNPSMCLINIGSTVIMCLDLDTALSLIHVNYRMDMMKGEIEVRS